MNQFRATLWVRKIYDKGMEGYWTWELLLFASPSPCHAKATLIPQFRFGSMDEAIQDAEHMANLFNIKVDQRSYPVTAKQRKPRIK